MTLPETQPGYQTPKIAIQEVPVGPVNIARPTHSITGETVSFGDGFLLSFGRLETHSAVEFEATAPESTHFHLFSQISGNSRFYSNDFAAMDLSAGNVILFRPRENPGGLSRIKANMELKCFEIHFSIDRLIEWFGDDVPKEIWPLLSHDIQVGLGLPLPVLNAQHQLGQLIHSRPFTHGLEKIALEGAALHMCAAYLSYLGDENMRDWPAIERREERIAYSAREILLSDLRNPPGLSELARMVGLPPRRLNVVFKDIFGMSVFQALSQARLDYARTSLLTSGLTVKEVAFATGYNHVSNFSAAFKSRFGVAPSRISGKTTGDA